MDVPFTSFNTMKTSIFLGFSPFLSGHVATPGGCVAEGLRSGADDAAEGDNVGPQECERWFIKPMGPAGYLMLFWYHK